jgi:hypothetical protein
MLYSTCRTCGRQISRAARICVHCGALTGASRQPSQEPFAGVSGFITAVAVGLIALVVAWWTGLLP